MRKDLTLAFKDEGTEIYRVLLTLSVKSTSRSRGKKEKRNGEKRTIMPTYFHLFFIGHVSIPNTPNIFSNQSVYSSSTICTNLSRCKENVYPRYWKTTRHTQQGLVPLNADLQNSCLLVDSLVQEIYAKPKDLNNPSLQPNPISCDHVSKNYHVSLDSK